MKKIIFMLVALVATFSVAIAATGTLLQHAQVTQAPTTPAAVSAAEEPISLSAPLVAAGFLAVCFLAARRRVD